MGPDEEPPHELQQRHPCRNRGAIHAGGQEPLSGPVYGMEGLCLDKHQAIRPSARLQPELHGILSGSAQPYPDIRLDKRRRQLQRHIQLDAWYDAGRRTVARKRDCQQPHAEHQRGAEPGEALQPHPVPEEDQREVQQAHINYAEKERGINVIEGQGLRQG